MKDTIDMMKDTIDMDLRIHNMTPLQKKIRKAIKGHELGEVIHAFELMKIAMLVKSEKE